LPGTSGDDWRLQGYFVAFHKIPAFIVTLAACWSSGLALWLLRWPIGRPVPEGIPVAEFGLHPDPLGG
jgi:ABC-type xylose transport system permease subunit